MKQHEVILFLNKTIYKFVFIFEEIRGQFRNFLKEMFQYY